MLRRAFSLLELLVVVALICGFMGMVFASSTLRRDERRALVQGAAAELAATLRQARAYAMERNVVAALSFNIENAPGTSGWTLNNRSGGHWYQIIGPTRARVSTNYNTDGHFPFPRSRYYETRGSWTSGDVVDSPFRYFLEAVDSAWYGDRHLLAKGKVRFLAIGDQDNGDRCDDAGRYQPAGKDFFYPRPWFGRWDDAAKRLHPWGGYEPACLDFASSPKTGPDSVTPVSFTGFFYEGKDGPITGSVNPRDRGILDDTNGDGVFRQSGANADDQSRMFPLYQAGNPRPLIDARWLDLYFIFNPDGTVRWGPPFSARREWGKGARIGRYQFGSGNFGAFQHLIGPGERSGHSDGISPYDMVEVGNYDAHTGAYYITLGPDVPAGRPAEDEGRHPSVEAAIAALRPLFRVYITPGGEVGWFEVTGKAPSSVSWEPTPWSNTTFLGKNYPDGTLREADNRLRGRPAVDFLVPEMLRSATWWMR